jgi:hypothetical protein
VQKRGGGTMSTCMHQRKPLPWVFTCRPFGGGGEVAGGRCNSNDTINGRAYQAAFLRAHMRRALCMMDTTFLFVHRSIVVYIASGRL